ncbi:MAG TPA: alpha/beta hydrolase [Ignavibacteriales bacterium]|nr:alpha/beta hydrolase [Ignavibacteriales bacterium]
MILLYALIIIVLLFITLYLIPAFTPPINDTMGKLITNSIASLEKVKLGGQDQWILIRGADITKPIILFLHGGPGTSNMGLLRGQSSELEKYFVVVSWDQRGAGKSFSAKNPESSMTINQFIRDTYELVNLLRNRFNQNKIFLAGHSWGSVLGVLTVKEYPELFYSYIGIGQTVHMLENEKTSYQWTLEQAKNAKDEKAVKVLNDIGIPPYSGNWQKKFMLQRRLLGKFGGEFYGSSKGAFPIVIKSLLLATEYSFMDKINFFRGIFNSVRLLWPELMKVNLNLQAPELKVPVFFILGRHDFEAPSVLAENYFNNLIAPYKELIWFENSAHMPNTEENKKFDNLIINKILSTISKKELYE